MEPQTSNFSHTPAPRARRKPTVFGDGGGWMVFFFGIFGAFGVGIFYLCYILLAETLEIRERGIAVPGTVTRLEYKSDSDGGGAYYPEVTFATQDGMEYRFMNDSGSDPASFDVGEAVEVLYLPESPESAKINAFFSLWGGALICGVMGLIFGGIGLGGLIYGIRKRRMNGWLLAHGQRVEAKISHVEKPVGKQTHYTIHAQWLNEKDQKMYMFTSEGIAFNPEEFLRGTVEVLIDPADPSDYLMDISNLPETA